MAIAIGRGEYPGGFSIRGSIPSAPNIWDTAKTYARERLQAMAQPIVDRWGALFPTSEAEKGLIGLQALSHVTQEMQDHRVYISSSKSDQLQLFVTTTKGQRVSMKLDTRTENFACSWVDDANAIHHVQVYKNKPNSSITNPHESHAGEFGIFHTYTDPSRQRRNRQGLDLPVYLPRVQDLLETILYGTTLGGRSSVPERGVNLLDRMRHAIVEQTLTPEGKNHVVQHPEVPEALLREMTQHGRVAGFPDRILDTSRENTMTAAFTIPTSPRLALHVAPVGKPTTVEHHTSASISQASGSWRRGTLADMVALSSPRHTIPSH